jgi:hypothetical protein
LSEGKNADPAEESKALMPVVSPAKQEDILAAIKSFEWFKSNILTPKDYQPIGDRNYIKKSGWMKIALACNVSLEKREERAEDRPDNIRIYDCTYRAIAPNGRFADAVGTASTNERQFTHSYHDVRALAQTRACNRAISNLVGGGEVSAEEITDTEAQEPANDMKSQQPVTTPNYAIPTEGTKPPTETPVPPAQSPEPVKHSWHVPLTTNQLSPFHIEKGIRQVFLAKGLQSFGVINQDTVNNELAIIPEKTIDIDAGPIYWFIEGTPYRKGVVKPICEKHGLQYEIVLEGKLLKAIVIHGGSLDQEHVKEIAGGATWAFQRAFEEAK